VAVVEKERLWWKPGAWLADPLVMRDATGWMASAFIHGVALIALAMLTLVVPLQSRLTLSILPPALEDETLVPQEFHYSVDEHAQVGALGNSGLASARPSAPVEALESEVAIEVDPTAAVGNIEVQDFTRTVLAGPNIPENIVVKGAGSVGTSGAMGAVDRITHEILLSLDKRPTTVLWLFDQSGSLKPQRESIAKRFDKIYDELGVIKASGNAAFKHDEKPLLTAVATFGKSVELLTPKATDDLTEIKSAVRSVSLDDSGTENVFNAVGFLAEKFRQQRLAKPRRNVMRVVFTAEA